MPGDHAVLSASGAERWMECPPSARLEEKLPETNNVYADEGTLAHEICKISLQVILHVITRDVYKAKFAELSANELYNQEMLDHCEGYVAYVLEQYNMEPGNRMYIEQRLIMDRWIPEGFGTSDSGVLHVSRRRLTVIDLKYGKGLPVFAENNKQGMIYALGAVAKYGDKFEFDDVEIIIYQPRLDSISKFVISTETLLLWAAQILKPAAALAWSGKGEFNPGDHCRFCGIKTSCRALHDHAISILKTQFEDEGKEESLKPGPLLTDAEISDVLRKSDLFKNWLGAIEEMALQKSVHDGKEWPGFKLVEGTSRRSITDPELAIFRLETWGYADDIFINKKLKSFEDLTKKMGKLSFEHVLGPVIVKPKGAPTLVELTDPRPAINSVQTVQNMFAAEDLNDLV